MHTITPKGAYNRVARCLQKGLVPLLLSAPGVGKSATVKQVAEDYGLQLIDIRLSQALPEDLNGFPKITDDENSSPKAKFIPFDTFPLKGDELPEGKNGWLLFLDELTSAQKPVQAAAYKLVLDRQIGNHDLHSNCFIVGAGNRVKDRAVANAMSTALQSRLISYELEVDVDEWIEMALNNRFDSRVISFIGFSRKRLHDFQPDHQDKTFPCPRTWEFVSKLIQGESDLSDFGPDIEGAVGEGAAAEFMTYAREFTDLPKYADIVSNPKGIAVPQKNSTRYAVTSMLIDATKDRDLADIIVFMKRMDIELQIVFVRGYNALNPTSKQTNSALTKYLVEMGKFMK